MTETAPGTVRTVRRSDHVTEAVVDAVAEAKGVDPLELEPLYTVVDPDALNNMFRPAVGSASSALELSFSMEGCEVVVRGDGEVAVTPPAETDGESTALAPSDD